MISDDTVWICQICCLKASKNIAWARRIMEKLPWMEGVCEVCQQELLISYWQKFKKLEDSILSKNLP